MLMVSGPPLGHNANCCCGPRGEIPSFPSMEVDDRSADGAHAPVHPDLHPWATPDGGCDEAVPDDALHSDDGSLTAVESPAHSSGDIVQKSGRNNTHRRSRLGIHAKWKRDMKKRYTSDESSFSERMKRRLRCKKNKKRKKEEYDPTGGDQNGADLQGADLPHGADLHDGDRDVQGARQLLPKLRSDEMFTQLMAMCQAASEAQPGLSKKGSPAGQQLSSSSSSSSSKPMAPPIHAEKLPEMELFLRTVNKFYDDAPRITKTSTGLSVLTRNSDSDKKIAIQPKCPAPPKSPPPAHLMLKSKLVEHLRKPAVPLPPPPPPPPAPVIAMPKQSTDSSALGARPKWHAPAVLSKSSSIKGPAFSFINWKQHDIDEKERTGLGAAQLRRQRKMATSKGKACVKAKMKDRDMRRWHERHDGNNKFDLPFL